MIRELVFFCLVSLSLTLNVKKLTSPPHCTHITKDTDYISRYQFSYPTAYIIPGQHEAYQKLYCINPPAVNKAVATVCDWAAPPLVQFTLGDTFFYVKRQDPSGRFQGNAVISTFQYCSHNNITSLDNEVLDVVVTEVKN